MSRTQPVYRALSYWNDGRALAKGPGAYAKRVVRKRSHRGLAKLLRKVLGS